MGNNEREPFVPYTTEQKQEFGKQFSPEQKRSYRKGQRNAYSHMANIGKNHSFFIQDNMNKDSAAAASKAAPAPSTSRQYNKPNNAAPQGQQQMSLPTGTATSKKNGK